jgi:hypothetical protein
MFFRLKRDPERDRWYLLPAMQHGARRKFYQRLLIAIGVGLVTAAVLGTVIYFTNRI